MINCSYGKYRELPDGARQPGKCSELASERPAEGLLKIG